MNTKMATSTLFAVVLVATVSGYALGLSHNRSRIEALAQQVERLKDQARSREPVSAVQALADDTIYLALRGGLIAGLIGALWGGWVLVARYRDTYYPNKRGQLPAVERTVAKDGEKGFMILDHQPTGGVTFGTAGPRSLDTPFSSRELLELTAMFSAVRAVAALPPGPEPRRALEPAGLIAALAGRGRALPEIRVVRDVRVEDVLAELDGPGVELLAGRVE